MRKCFAVIIALLISLCVFSCAAAAAENDSKTEEKAEAFVSIELPDNAAKGKDCTVTVKYSSKTEFDRIVGILRYDPKLLEYVSGGSGLSKVGSVDMRGYGGGVKEIFFDIKFKVLDQGEAALKVLTVEGYNTKNKSIGKPAAETVFSINEKSREVKTETPAEESAISHDMSIYISAVIICVIAALMIVLFFVMKIRQNKRS